MVTEEEVMEYFTTDEYQPEAHFCKTTYDHIAYVQTSFPAVYLCFHLVAGPSVVRLSLSDIRCLTKR